jgi:hypothetical protein
LIPVLALLLAACGKPPAHGTANGLVVGATDEAWTQIEDSVRAAMQPTIFTVREEPTFRVTQMDPTEEAWSDLRRFIQVLVFGDRSDPWVAQALERAGTEGPPDPPEIIQTHNVWATNQQVTLILIPEDAPPEAAYTVLGDLHDLMDAQYRRWARNKMFLSGRDTALADTLEQTAGFRLLLPEVYEWRRDDSVYVFRNDNPDPSDLIRQVAVTWRSPAPEPEELGGEYLTSWRESLVEEHYEQGQVLDPEDSRSRRTTYRDHPAFVLQGVWRNPPEYGWPAAGPFITRAVVCQEQDRLYLLDAWLYAPGKDKYEYMIQLETILDSFEC